MIEWASSMFNGLLQIAIWLFFGYLAYGVAHIFLCDKHDAN